MSYRDNVMYKAYKLKMDALRKEQSGKLDHELSKIDMFARDAFDEQQATIDRLEQEKQELVELVMVSQPS